MAEIESLVVSLSGTKYPRSPSLCEEALQERELVWVRLPKTIYLGYHVVPLCAGLTQPGQRHDQQRVATSSGEGVQGPGIACIQSACVHGHG